MRTLFLIALLLLAGCASEFSGRLTPEEQSQVIALAVQRVESSGLLTPAELANIKGKDPQMRYYMLAGRSDVQYFISWPISSGE